MDRVTYSSKEDSEFYRQHLIELSENYSGFQTYFRIQEVLFVIYVAISAFALILTINSTGVIGIIQGLFLVLNIVFIVWLTMLLKKFFELQVNRLIYEYKALPSYRGATMDNAKELLLKAKQKAPNIVNTIKIGGSIIGPFSNIIGEKNEVVQQQISAQKNEIKEALALLLAYCQETGNQDAIAAAEKINREAAKESIDKRLIIATWTKLVSIVPTIAQVVAIVGGIQKLLA